MSDRPSLWVQNLGASVEYVDAGGVRTRVISRGSGPLVILLPGTGGHAEMWIPNLGDLAGLGLRPVAVDPIGHGFTGKPAGMQYTMDDYVDHILATVAALGYTSCAIVGESLGGWIGMRAALRAPEVVTRVVSLTGGGLRPLAPVQHELDGWSNLERLSIAAISSDDPSVWRTRMNWLVADPSSMPDEMVETRRSIYAAPGMREAGERIYRSVFQMLRGERPGAISEQELKSFPVPVYYLWTDSNPTTPASVAEVAYKLTPSAKFDVMTDCGHWPSWEDPGGFLGYVAPFLQESS
jgi:pimeloyl-ACP methyl ester carboxylesterase